MNKTILYIEDTEEMNEVITEILKDSGFDVISCRTPRIALKSAEENKNVVNIILLDIMMPSQQLFSLEESQNDLLTGILLINRLNETFGKELPIVVKTAFNDKDVLYNLEKKQQVRRIFDRNVDFEELINFLEKCV